MDTVVQIVRHTPIYVFLALAYGLFAGIRALRPRSMALLAMPVIPAVFLTLSVTSLIPAAVVLPAAALAWLVAAGVGVAMGVSFLSPSVTEIDRSRGRMTVGGSALVLVLFVVIFSLKYLNGIVHGTNPTLAGSPGFIIGMTTVSGLSAGIMTGRIARLFLVYFRRQPAAA